ncbi:sensor histidine kinase [Bacillus sp. FJAT-45037]|uniref:sensor histidine kinase n=1 Tax=Bacillus sp. FJAT-45037 TaxID=2011007 RepID=UPI000C232B82|nr:HAMP domain-containing sensor histidine kinase [Bacillus sp. FJAT-45037]
MIGLKARLFFAFLSIILIPIFIVVVMMFLYSSNLEKSEARQEEEIDLLFSKLREEITNLSFEEESLPDVYATMHPLLEEYEMDVQINSVSGELLFDSRDWHTEEGNKNFQFHPFHLQVAAENGELVEVEVISNSSDVAPFTFFNEIIKYLLISIGTGLFVLVALIVGWIWYLSRTILQPLKEIYIASEEMRIGNLDYTIQYNRNDEIGRFIDGFNLMRDHMKKSDEKKAQYEKSRKELIAGISHDLRTPLSSIKGYVEGLQDGIIQNEEMKEKYLKVISAKTNQLDYLIEDLFDYSKLELDQLTMDKQWINSQAFFDMVIDEAQFEVRKQGVTLQVSELIPKVKLYIDPNRLQQVMTNLFENAIRYGGNTLKISLIEGDHLFYVSVADNGPGIHTEDLPFIFNQFYRGDKSRSRHSGGSGLGLAISKRIIEAHGGTISVQSVVGEGTTFEFSLPLKEKGREHRNSREDNT